MASSDVAPDIPHPNPLRALGFYFLYGLGGARRGAPRLVRTQHVPTLWLRGGAYRGCRSQARPRRRDTLITPRRRGPLVHQAARRRLQQRPARRLDQGPAPALHLGRPSEL
jgi:hypothetical protein